MSTHRHLACALAALGLGIPAQAVAQPTETGGMAYSAGAAKRTPAEVPGAKARVTRSGMAVAPAGAPAVVKRLIAAGNRIATKPYRYGGGHRRWKDTGYDCSGSVSYALHGAGLLKASMASGGFTRWARPGRGRWVTVYANGGHMYMVVAGLRFDTSGLSGAGSRWQRATRSPAGYSVRHPQGL